MNFIFPDFQLQPIKTFFKTAGVVEIFAFTYIICLLLLIIHIRHKTVLKSIAIAILHVILTLTFFYSLFIIIRSTRRHPLTREIRLLFFNFEINPIYLSCFSLLSYMLVTKIENMDNGFNETN